MEGALEVGHDPRPQLRGATVADRDDDVRLFRHRHRPVETGWLGRVVRMRVVEADDLEPRLARLTVDGGVVARVDQEATLLRFGFPLRSRGLARVLGPASVTWTDEVAAVHAGTTTLLLARAEDIGMLHPPLARLEPPAAPVAVAMGIRADPARTGDFLERQGVAHEVDAAGGIIVAPAEACGVLVEFVAA